MEAQNRSSALVDERGVAGWEIISVASSALIAELAIQSLAGRAKWLGLIPIVLALSLMFFSHRQRGETLRTLGFRFDNFVPALRLAILPTIVVIVLILLASWLLSSSGFSLRPVRMRLLLVPLWALFQQYALQGFINRRAQLAFGPGLKSILVVALVFSLLHLPGPLLILLAFAGGLVLGWIYQRQANLFAVALSHALVSLTLSLVIPAHFAYQLRIGFKYFG